MKKNKCSLYFGVSMLALLATTFLYTEAYHATSDSDSPKVSIKTELAQTESITDYKQTQLDNRFGPSDNQSSGIYKKESDVITIYVDENTDQLSLPTYTISPVALTDSREGHSERTPLKKGENIISTRDEGVIHLQNTTEPTPQNKLTVTVEGGLKLPRFIFGKTTEADWQKELKQNPLAPGYELIGKKTLITGSRVTLPQVKDPKTIVETYDRIIDIHDKSSGLDNSSTLHRKSRGLIQHMRETQEPQYYMYATYNHTAYSQSEGMGYLLSPSPDNHWGPMHEFGHTYQSLRMTWSNMTEVTVNIYSMRSNKALGNRSRLEKDHVYEKVSTYFNQANKNYETEDLFTRLAMFWQLELAFGDDFYPKLHKLYREEAKDIKNNDLEKIQYFITSTSKIANKNLLPYFEMWGLTISPETKQVLEKYPKLTHKIWEHRDEPEKPISPIDIPEPPVNLPASDINYDSVKLNWQAGYSINPIKEYVIFRDDKEIARTSSESFIDKTVKSNTLYTYTLTAIDTMGKMSKKNTSFKVRIPNKAETEIPVPTKPNNLTATSVLRDRLSISWDKSSSFIGISNYNVYRNGLKIASTKNLSFEDTQLKPDTTYTYEIIAIDTFNRESPKSDVLTVKTLAFPTPTLPTKPSNLSANEITQNSLTLSWTRSDSPIGISQYNVYRNGIKITTVRNTPFKDTNLKPNTTYTYEIIAIDTFKQESEKSEPLTVKTQGDSNGLSVWKSTEVYNEGDKVLYNGLQYEAKWWNQNNRPDQSDAWKLLSNQSLEWELEKSYEKDDTVTFQGQTYIAKWWTQGDQPGISPVWELI
ncbi:M60 family metallopeptidase [Candidatus Enterococcus ikei]|uniref:M60 family metallopeptidase n=1 Tax=Candidatus Enterococcus ikei TaxID=2815326 RepID=A0ABS3GZU7_9ENTE|nr:M60 family metallopeptidase [Enterococcus sp. DIV0869a]MBO0440778.1 M60 family metallopeptidase [Enterococcus sp. DIV0869a]